MGGNVCKWRKWQEINLLNIKAAHAIQYKTSNNTIKNGKKI